MRIKFGLWTTLKKTTIPSYKAIKSSVRDLWAVIAAFIIIHFEIDPWLV